MNAVIYARYSSDNQREESIEGQLRECKEYADQNGITVVRTYIDRALSAKTDSRPQFQQMIHDSATHTFEAVLVWKLDRFSRNRYDSAHYKRILKNNRVHVVSVTEPISNTPEGIMLESLLEGMAEYYSAELAEKVSRGHKENALKAKFNGGPVPLGYRIDSEHHYQIDPATAPVVQEAFQRYAAGESIRSIIESLNARGIRNSRGTHSPRTVSRPCSRTAGIWENIAIRILSFQTLFRRSSPRSVSMQCSVGAKSIARPQPITSQMSTIF